MHSVAAHRTDAPNLNDAFDLDRRILTKMTIDRVGAFLVGIDLRKVIGIPVHIKIIDDAAIFSGCRSVFRQVEIITGHNLRVHVLVGFGFLDLHRDSDLVGSFRQLAVHREGARLLQVGLVDVIPVDTHVLVGAAVRPMRGHGIRQTWPDAHQSRHFHRIGLHKGNDRHFQCDLTIVEIRNGSRELVGSRGLVLRIGSQFVVDPGEVHGIRSHGTVLHHHFSIGRKGDGIAAFLHGGRQWFDGLDLDNVDGQIDILRRIIEPAMNRIIARLVEGDFAIHNAVVIPCDRVKISVPLIANAQSRRKRDGGSDRSGNRSAQNLADFHDLDGDGRLQIGSINGTLHRYISRLLHLIGSQLIPMDGPPTLRAILVTDPNRTVQLRLGESHWNGGGRLIRQHRHNWIALVLRIGRLLIRLCLDFVIGFGLFGFVLIGFVLLLDLLGGILRQVQRGSGLLPAAVDRSLEPVGSSGKIHQIRISRVVIARPGHIHVFG